MPLSRARTTGLALILGATLAACGPSGDEPATPAGGVDPAQDSEMTPESALPPSMSDDAPVAPGNAPDLQP